MQLSSGMQYTCMENVPVKQKKENTLRGSTQRRARYGGMPTADTKMLTDTPGTQYTHRENCAFMSK